MGIHPVILLPFFFAILAAMNIGAFAASRFLFPPPDISGVSKDAAEILEISESAGISVPAESSVPFEGLSSALLKEPEVQNDFVMDSYRNPETRDWVISFFERICGSARVAQAILEGADRYSISPSLAFALSWEESRFNSRAVSRKNRDDSLDRGLFQLNNKSFPKLGDAEFFDTRLNASYGMAHLRFCLDTGGSEIAALAMYNAGTGRVRSGGTPRQTLDYTARVLSARRKIDKAFQDEWIHCRTNPQPADSGNLPPEPAEIAKAPAVPKAGGFPLPILLSPLCRH
ncbi:MAG: lytic transglycosylase domain-containing protein [Treponema sp.]|jgi:hypothetical protein|nr:lytic transglycosylase domain-containing protein [Treponema sp.]